MTNNDPTNFRQTRRRTARGQDRPQYLDSPDLDRVFIMMMSMLAELSAVQDRLDTHEVLAAQGVPGTSEAIEAYELDDARKIARDARRDAMLDRVLRVVVEERDARSEAQST